MHLATRNRRLATCVDKVAEVMIEGMSNRRRHEAVVRPYVLIFCFFVNLLILSLSLEKEAASNSVNG